MSASLICLPISPLKIIKANGRQLDGAVGLAREHPSMDVRTGLGIA